MPAKPSTELPEHVRRLVDEIETEIGEAPGHPVPGDTDLPRTVAAAAIEGGQVFHDAAEVHRVEAAVRQILVEMGEDPDRQGLLGTPERVRRMYLELTAGYWVDPDRLLNGAIFDVDYSEMVVVKDIAFYSLCEHHLLPFFGSPVGRLHPARPRHRPVQDPAHRRDVRAPAAGPGAHDPADRRFPDGAPRAAGRRRRGRGVAPVRGHARRAQAGHDHDHSARARPVPRRPTGRGPSSSATSSDRRRDPEPPLRPGSRLLPRRDEEPDERQQPEPAQDEQTEQHQRPLPAGCPRPGPLTSPLRATMSRDGRDRGHDSVAAAGGAPADAPSGSIEGTSVRAVGCASGQRNAS